MKKFLMKPLTLVLALVLALVPVTAAAAPDVFGFDYDTGKVRTMHGDNDTINPVLSVMLPVNLDFVLDPFNIDPTVPWQTGKTDMYAVNFMPTNVLVDVELTATGAGLEFYPDSSYLNKNIGVATKGLVFGVIGATSGTFTDGVTYIIPTTGVVSNVYATTATSPLNPIRTAATEAVAFSTGGSFGNQAHNAAFVYEDTAALKSIFTSEDGATPGARIQLVLGKAGGGNAANDPRLPQTTPDLANGIGSFMFYADLNTQANWADSAITVTGKYTLGPCGDDEFNTLYPASERVGLNVRIPGGASEPSFTQSPVVLIKASHASGFTVPFNKGSGTITSAGLNTVVWTEGNEYTLSGNTILVSAARVSILPAGSHTIRIWVDGVEYTAPITIS